MSDSIFSSNDTNLKRRFLKNKIAFILTGLCLLIIMLPVIGILYQVIVNGIAGASIEALTEVGGSPLSTQTGISHAIKGTVMTTLVASIIGIPLGILVGVYLAYYGDTKFSDVLRVVIDSMVSIPTIITGVVAWTLIVVTMGDFSILSGGIALAIIMIPILSKTTEEMIRLVPESFDEAGYALGLTRFTTASSIVLPIASRGIASGVILTIGRIIGETAPLLFTAFFSQNAADNILDSSATLTTLIFNYAIAPFEYWHTLAWFAAFLLLLFNLGIIIITKVYFRKN